MGKLFFFLVIILTLIYALLNPASINSIVIQTLTLWFLIVLPSILPMYLIAHFLIRIPLFTKLLYPILKPILHFENKTACAIYLVSILSGNPTSISLITSAYEKKLISIKEANRLNKFCSFISPLFIMAFSNKLHLGFAYLFILSQVLASIIIAYFLPQKSDYKKAHYDSMTIETIKIETISEILSKAPTVLLNIGVTMVIVNIIKEPLLLLINSINPKTFILYYFLCLLEISTGLNDIINANLPLTTSIILFSTLFSLSGVAIHLQVITIISKKPISYSSFVLFRIIQMLIAILIIISFIFHFVEILLIVIAITMLINVFKVKLPTKEKVPKGTIIT